MIKTLPSKLLVLGSLAFGLALGFGQPQPARAADVKCTQLTNETTITGDPAHKPFLDPAIVAPCLDPDQTDSQYKWILKTWYFSLGVINSLAVVVLILMAFANIVYPWQALEPYRIRQLLPSFIAGIVLANASLFICRAVVAAADILMSNKGFHIDLVYLYQAWGINNPGDLQLGVIAAVYAGKMSIYTSGLLYQLLVSTFIVYIPLIAMFALSFVFYIRFGVIFLFTAISPLAFGAIIFPASQKLLQTWWDTFWKWTFGGVASYFLLYLAAQVNGGHNTPTAGGVTIDIIPYAISLALVYLAIITPFKLGGAIMTAVQAVSKKGLGYGKTAAGLGWAGYGTTMARAKKGKWSQSGLGNWKNLDTKGRLKAIVAAPFGGGLKTLAGVAADKANLYGLNDAVKLRMEATQKDALKQARKGEAYNKFLGREESIEFFRKDMSEGSRSMSPVSLLGLAKKVGLHRFMGYEDEAMTKPLPENQRLTDDEKRTFMSGKKEDRVAIANKLGLNSEDAGTLSDLMREYENKAARNYVSSTTETLDKHIGMNLEHMKQPDPEKPGYTPPPPSLRVLAQEGQAPAPAAATGEQAAQAAQTAQAVRRAEEEEQAYAAPPAVNVKTTAITKPDAAYTAAAQELTRIMRIDEKHSGQVATILKRMYTDKSSDRANIPDHLLAELRKTPDLGVSVDIQSLRDKFKPVMEGLNEGLAKGLAQSADIHVKQTLNYGSPQEQQQLLSRLEKPAAQELKVVLERAGYAGPNAKPITSGEDVKKIIEVHGQVKQEIVNQKKIDIAGTRGDAHQILVQKYGERDQATAVVDHTLGEIAEQAQRVYDRNDPNRGAKMADVFRSQLKAQFKDLGIV